MNVKLTSGKMLPIEMHKVRIVQKANLKPIDRRLEAITEAGHNTFLLNTRDIFIDMLTDSGTNAMSDNQLAAMMVADDAYAGGESYYKMGDAIKDILGFKNYVPAHQGRACEHLLAKMFVKPGTVIPMNYHFTTTKAHFEMHGGKVLEIYCDDALETCSTNPFKGNMDLVKFQKVIDDYGTEKIPFVRMEATTNLIGGQPFSLNNLKAVSKMARANGIPVIIDCSLISENAYFIKRREADYMDCTIGEIVLDMMAQADLIYASGRKSTCVRGGFIATNDDSYFNMLKELLPIYEGFITYGGMSSKEIEAMAVGLREMVDIDVASSSADLIQYFVDRMVECGLPAVTPAGGLAGHIDAMKFVGHIPQLQYPAGALAAALYVVSGVRSMERGTISMERDENGNEVPSDLELVRMAVPRRVYSISHMEYVTDRLAWLWAHREMIGGLKFTYEPPILRFFTGKMEAIDNWTTKLADAYKADFGSEA